MKLSKNPQIDFFTIVIPGTLAVIDWFSDHTAIYPIIKTMMDSFFPINIIGVLLMGWGVIASFLIVLLPILLIAHLLGIINLER